MKKLTFLSAFILSIIFLSFFGNVNQKKLYNVIPTLPEGDWFEKQRAFPFDEIPNDERLKSIEYVKQMPVSQTDALADWTLAGPTNIEGRITVIAIHPTNPQIVYAGCANGGVWKSTNFCQSWVSVFDNQNTSSVGALAIDPSNGEVIYCGTGEANSLRSYYPGTGIYKSTNGGASWTSIGLTGTYSFGNISINPLNTQEIYTAAVGSLRRKNTERGVYKSTNGGTSWTQSLYVSDSVGAIDVAVVPNNPTKVFAAMWERQRREDYIKYGGPMTALYVSTNSGASWSVVTGGFPSNDATLGRISMDICRTNPLVIYALTANADGYSRGLYKSTDGGTSWTLINSSVANSSSYAWFNRICKVDPNNANIVYCGGLYIERSTNGGTSFSTAYSTHVDQHALCFAPSNSNYIVEGNDGGVDYSSNGGSSWSYSTSLPVTQFYAGDIDYLNPSTMFGGSQDNSIHRSTNNSLIWTTTTGGDGFYCIVDYTNSQIVYASNQHAAIYRSTNGGNSFSSISGALPGSGSNVFNWMTPFVIDKNTPTTFYTGSYTIYKSTNSMGSWTSISPNLTNGHIQNFGTITTIDVAKSNPNVIYAGTDDANVWVTTNGGGNWTKVNSGLPYRWVTRVTVHPDSANVCYVTLSGYKVDSTGSHIYRTTNYGSSWTSIKGNLPDAPINDVVINPYYYSTLYIATDVGVMVTTNLGASWSLLGNGMPQAIPCHDLTIHKPTGKLVVWTHGRSAYYTMTLVGVTQQNNEVPEKYTLYQNYPNPFNPKSKIKYQIAKSQIQNRKVLLVIYNSLGQEIQTLVNDVQSAGTYEVEWDGTNYPSGIYFYRLTAGDFNDTKRMILIK